MRPFALSLSLLLWFSAALAAEGYGLDRMEMRAQLAPQRFTILSAELPAKIEHISVREGEPFTKGQVLIEFECSLQAAQLDKAKAQLFAAQNTYEASQRLVKLKAIGQVESRNAEAEVMKAKADVAYLDATIEKCRISAPYNGRTGELKAREQQFVQAGQALLEILDEDALELEFILPSRWLTWIKPGHSFEVKISETERNYPAKLVRIAAKADPVSQSIKAIGQIQGQFAELRPGMSGVILLQPPQAAGQEQAGQAEK